MRSLWKKVRRFEKGTLPPVVAVVTKISYGPWSPGLLKEFTATYVPFTIEHFVNLSLFLVMIDCFANHCTIQTTLKTKIKRLTICCSEPQNQCWHVSLMILLICIPGWLIPIPLRSLCVSVNIISLRPPNIKLWM